MQKTSMTNDRKIQISIGGSRKSTTWQTTDMLVSELYAKLAQPVRSNMTMQEYDRLTKAKKSDAKDVGGFVGGSLRDGRRKAHNVNSRDIITLDADNITAGATDMWLKRLEGLGVSYCVYSTRSHREQAPRLRIIIPMVQALAPDAYCFVAREMAYYIDGTMQIFDPTTFQPERLMFWPSVDSDQPYVYAAADKPFLLPDSWLQGDAWRNMATWRQVPGHEADEAALRAINSVKQPPEEALGIVGIFNRTYSIYDVMDQFLPGVYEPCLALGENRYTYTGGSSAGGAVVYDDHFLYSHHATDPAGGVLCNAFDLVRLHRYPDMDNEVNPRTPMHNRPSYVEMKKYAKTLPGVQETIAADKAANMDSIYEAAYGKLAPVDDFCDVPMPEGNNTTPKPETPPATPAGQESVFKPSMLMGQLDMDDRGNYDATINNYRLILENDPQLQGCLWYNQFTGADTCERLPGREDPRPVTFGMRTDIAPIVQHLQMVYGIKLNMRYLELAVAEVLKAHTRHPVREWLETLQWDGVERLDGLLVRTLGAEDTALTRAITRKIVCAVVQRSYFPGSKFDAMLVLVGGQGTGKSTLSRILAIRPEWHVDSVPSFNDKKGYEVITGNVVVEVAEMAAYSKTDVRSMKNFITQTSYRYRPAYGDKTLDYPAQCVLIGTTNEKEFLNDPTGGRRYWIVDTEQSKYNIDWAQMNAAQRDIGQIYAEAKHRLFNEHEPLVLPAELEQELQAKQEAEYTERSAWYDEIKAFLDMPVPEDWHEKTLAEKVVYVSNTTEFEAEAEKQATLMTEPRTLEYTTTREVFELVIRQRTGGEHVAYDKRIQLEIARALQECKMRKHDTRRNNRTGKYWLR